MEKNETPGDLRSKEQYWREHFGKWKASGLSIAKYCACEELSKSSFGYWRHKLLKQEKKSKLVEVRLPVNLDERALIHIRLRQDVELGVSTGTDVEYVSRLVSALKDNGDAH